LFSIVSQINTLNPQSPDCILIEDILVGGISVNKLYKFARTAENSHLVTCGDHSGIGSGLGSTFYMP